MDSDAARRTHVIQHISKRPSASQRVSPISTTHDRRDARPFIGGDGVALRHDTARDGTER